MSQEQVNHPSHYGGEDNTYEAIKVIENWNLGFCLGNTVKYISRAGKKDSGKVLEDLRKSRWYLDREIRNLEQAEKEKVAAGFSGKEIVEWMSRKEPAAGGLLPPLKKSPFFGEYGECAAHIVYCSDFNQHSKSTPPILTGHDTEKTLGLGATNRLKPVEDKAEVKEGCSMSEYLNGKWRKDAYDEPTKDDLGWFDREKFGSRPEFP